MCRRYARLTRMSFRTLSLGSRSLTALLALSESKQKSGPSSPTPARVPVVRGELTLVGSTCPVAFDVLIGGDGRLSASAVLKQTAWGSPYSTLFGALKVADEVEVTLDAGPL